MRMRLIPLMIVCAILLIGCGPAPAGDPADPQPTRTTQPTDLPPTPTPQPPIPVTGAGGSAPQTLFASWFELFAFVTARPEFTYNVTGSAAGNEAIVNGEVDFAASEIPLTEEQQEQAPELMMLPIATTAITIAYNLTDPEGGLIRSGLRFDANVLAGIYMGRISRWNDPEIVALNQDVRLSDQPIAVFHRKPGSGSTFLFTGYLYDLSADWRSQMGEGDNVTWLIGTGVETNQEMAKAIVDTPFSIGYLDLGDARLNYLTYGNIKNREGRFVEPNVESMQAAQSATVRHMPDTMDQVIANAQGVTSYPLTGYIYVIFHSDMDDCNKAWATISWYRWAVLLGDVSAAEAGFAPVIDEVEAQAFARFDQLFCGGHQPIPRLAVPLDN